MSKWRWVKKTQEEEFPLSFTATKYDFKGSSNFATEREKKILFMFYRIEFSLKSFLLHAYILFVSLRILFVCFHLKIYISFHPQKKFLIKVMIFIVQSSFMFCMSKYSFSNEHELNFQIDKVTYYNFFLSIYTFS